MHGMLVYNPGSARTPYGVTVKPTLAAAAVVSAIVAVRSSGGSAGGRHLVDLVNTTSWFGCENNGRGWTISQYNATSLGVTDAGGTPATNNTAQVTAGGADVGKLVRRLRATRTTKLDSLRGSERILLRARATVATDVWKLQGRHSPSQADPAFRANDVVTFAPGNVLYQEVDLGDVELPFKVPLAGVAVELWAQRVSGTGALHLDLVRLLPSGPEDVLTRLVAPAGSAETVLGKDLVTPVGNPAGGTAGVVITDSLQFDTLTDNAGVAPNVGLALPGGLHRYTFRLNNQFPPPEEGMLIRLRNITAGADKVFRDVLLPGAAASSHVLDAVISDANLYQPQVDNPSVTNLGVDWIKHEYIPAIGLDQLLRTDPRLDRLSVEHLDTSVPPAVVGEWGSEGPVPLWIPAGAAAVFVVPLQAGGESLSTMAAAATIEGAPRRYT